MIIAPFTAVTNGWVTHPRIQTLDAWHNNRLPNEASLNVAPNKIMAFGGEQYYVSASLQGADMQLAQKGEVAFGGQLYEGWNLEPGVYLVEGELTLNVPRGTVAYVQASWNARSQGVFIDATTFQPGTVGPVSFLMNVSKPTAIIDGTFVAELFFTSYEIPKTYQERDVAASRHYTPSGTFA